jgi:hypothetical protein
VFASKRGMVVFAAMTRSNVSGWSPTTRRPMSPPQSWQKRVRWLSPSTLMNAVTQATCCS